MRSWDELGISEATRVIHLRQYGRRSESGKKQIVFLFHLSACKIDTQFMLVVNLNTQIIFKCSILLNIPAATICRCFDDLFLRHLPVGRISSQLRLRKCIDYWKDYHSLIIFIHTIKLCNSLSSIILCISTVLNVISYEKLKFGINNIHEL